MSDEPMTELVVEAIVWQLFGGCLPQKVSPRQLAALFVDVFIEVNEVAGLDAPLSAWQYVEKRLAAAIETRLETQLCRYLESPFAN